MVDHTNCAEDRQTGKTKPLALRIKVAQSHRSAKEYLRQSRTIRQRSVAELTVIIHAQALEASENDVRTHVSIADSDLLTSRNHRAKIQASSRRNS
jgi:hypothetical protein